MNDKYLYVFNKEYRKFYKCKVVSISEKRININYHVTDLVTNQLDFFNRSSFFINQLDNNSCFLANIISFNFNTTKRLMNEYIQEQKKIFEKLKQVQDQGV